MKDRELIIANIELIHMFAVDTDLTFDESMFMMIQYKLVSPEMEELINQFIGA